MKKKIIALFATLLLCARGHAYADVLWQPYDSFYDKHYSEIESIHAPYEVSAEDGCILYTDPDEQKRLCRIETDEILKIGYSLSYKGEEWGWTSASDGEQYYTGWLHMRDLTRLYNGSDFLEDNEESIVTEYMDHDELVGDVVIWTYPNSGVIESVIICDPEDPWFRPINMREFFIDEDGLLWAYVGFYRSQYHGWICLDDPYSTELESRRVLTASEEFVKEPEPRSSSDLILVGGLVFGVEALTGSLIVLLKKRK